MCVLVTVMDAVDRGYLIVLMEYAVCSYSDDGHEAGLAIYRTRFAEHISVVQAADLVERPCDGLPPSFRMCACGSFKRYWRRTLRLRAKWPAMPCKGCSSALNCRPRPRNVKRLRMTSRSGHAI